MTKRKIAAITLRWAIKITLNILILRWVYFETGIVTTIAIGAISIAFDLDLVVSKLQLKEKAARDTLIKMIAERVQKNSEHVFRCQVVDAINRICLMPTCPYEEKAKRRGNNQNGGESG